MLRRGKFALCVSGHLGAPHFPNVFFWKPARGFSKCKWGNVWQFLPGKMFSRSPGWDKHYYCAVEWSEFFIQLDFFTGVHGRRAVSAFCRLQIIAWGAEPVSWDYSPSAYIQNWRNAVVIVFANAQFHSEVLFSFRFSINWCEYWVTFFFIACDLYLFQTFRGVLYKLYWTSALLLTSLFLGDQSCNVI